MKIRYYLGWFNEFFPEKLSLLLKEDIIDRQSLVMISANPSEDEDDGEAERSWLEQAGIEFITNHLINYHTQKEEAHRLIDNASVIFLLGGDTILQNDFIKEYELIDPIRTCKAIVVGASAGAINMSDKWLGSKLLGDDVETTSIYSGIGLDHFSVLSHYDLENNMELVMNTLSSFSKEIDIYASNKDCAIRVKDGKMSIIGDVYLISNAQIKKLEEQI